MSISRGSGIAPEADRWVHQGDCLVKGGSRFKVKLGGNDLVGSGEILSNLAASLNDPQAHKDTKLIIAKLLSGESSTAKVGAFEISALPEPERKVEKVFEKTVSPRTSETKKSPPPLPPKVHVPLQMQCERVGSWLFIFANNKFDNSFAITQNRTSGPQSKVNDAEIDKIVQKLNGIFDKPTNQLSADDKSIITSLRTALRDGSTAEIKLFGKIFNINKSTLSPEDRVTYNEKLAKTELQIRDKLNIAPPLPTLPPEGSVKLPTKSPPVPPRPVARPRSTPPELPPLPPPPVPLRPKTDTLPPSENAPARPVISPRDNTVGDKG